MCGARFKFGSAHRTSLVHGTGTSGFRNHFERYHPIEHALAKEASRSSSNAKQAKAQVLTGEQYAVSTLARIPCGVYIFLQASLPLNFHSPFSLSISQISKLSNFSLSLSQRSKVQGVFVFVSRRNNTVQIIRCKLSSLSLLNYCRSRTSGDCSSNFSTRTVYV